MLQNIHISTFKFPECLQTMHRPKPWTNDGLYFSNMPFHVALPPKKILVYKIKSNVNTSRTCVTF